MFWIGAFEFIRNVRFIPFLVTPRQKYSANILPVYSYYGRSNKILKCLAFRSENLRIFAIQGTFAQHWELRMCQLADVTFTCCLIDCIRYSCCIYMCVIWICYVGNTIIYCYFRNESHSFCMILCNWFIRIQDVNLTVINDLINTTFIIPIRFWHLQIMRRSNPCSMLGGGRWSLEIREKLYQQPWILWLPGKNTLHTCF